MKKKNNHPLAFLKPGVSLKKGGPIDTPYGQWQYPGEVTRIPSNRITMQGVNYPVLGVDNTGYKQMMLPGGEYRFPGSSVTEYPIRAQDGTTVPLQGGTLPSVEVAEANPNWVNYLYNYYEQNPKEKEIARYLKGNPLAARTWGQSMTNYPQRIDAEYDAAAKKYVAQETFKNNPKLKGEKRGEYLDRLVTRFDENGNPFRASVLENILHSNLEESKATKSNVWRNFGKGLLSLTEIQDPIEWVAKHPRRTKRIMNSKALSSKEKEDLLAGYQNSPVMTGLGEVAHILDPLNVPYNMMAGNLYTQSQGEKDYDWTSALSGESPYYQDPLLRVVADPFNYLTEGAALTQLAKNQGIALGQAAKNQGIALSQAAKLKGAAMAQEARRVSSGVRNLVGDVMEYNNYLKSFDKLEPGAQTTLNLTKEEERQLETLRKLYNKWKTSEERLPFSKKMEAIKKSGLSDDFITNITRIHPKVLDDLEYGINKGLIDRAYNKWTGYDFIDKSTGQIIPDNFLSHSKQTGAYNYEGLGNFLNNLRNERLGTNVIREPYEGLIFDPVNIRVTNPHGEDVNISRFLNDPRAMKTLESTPGFNEYQRAEFLRDQQRAAEYQRQSDFIDNFVNTQRAAGSQMDDWELYALGRDEFFNQERVRNQLPDPPEEITLNPSISSKPSFGEGVRNLSESAKRLAQFTKQKTSTGIEDIRNSFKNRLDAFLNENFDPDVRFFDKEDVYNWMSTKGPGKGKIGKKSYPTFDQVKGSLFRSDLEGNVNIDPNIDPVQESLMQMQQEIANSFKGRYIKGADSYSDSSYPLMLGYLAKNSKDGKVIPYFTGHKPLNTSGYLVNAGVSPNQIVGYINNKLAEFEKTIGVKVPRAYAKNGSIYIPDFSAVKQKRGGSVRWKIVD